jgi:hypothetical protein
MNACADLKWTEMDINKKMYKNDEMLIQLKFKRNELKSKIRKCIFERWP